MRQMLGQIIDRETIGSVIADVESLSERAPAVSLGALYILKNELTPGSSDDPKRRLVYQRRFLLPERLPQRLRTRHQNGGGLKLAGELATELWRWLAGSDAEHFRDRCDRLFWREMVPAVTEALGASADRVLNTVNEAIINYAEYSFARFAVGRRISVHLFATEDGLAYAVIRPCGSRLRPFDPLRLKIREPAPLALRKRGWGHTLLMERALFLSFDRAPRRRGMLIILGPG